MQISPIRPQMSPNAASNSYSVKEIIDRYESEEDEFLRELEDMRQSLQSNEQEDEMTQNPAPILTILCSLVDEIGSLRTENQRLKTKLAPPSPRPKNVVQRMSAIFDSRGNLFPRLLRPAHNEIRTGARERLSTPPRKDCITTSSISTDFSQESVGIREPPLVEPELSDSDIDDNVFLEVSLPSFPERRARRETSRRCEIPLSECTSPSSTSSRDPSEAMASSRSSFLELIGFRKKRDNLQSTTSLLSPSKPILKKRKRRVSEDELLASGLYSKSENSNYRSRQQAKPPRPMSYYPREDSEDSDNMRTKRKATSFLSVHSTNYQNPERLLRVDRETRLRHEKDNLEAETEELKMRNQRLVEQLREKSAQFSKLQFHVHKLDNQIDCLTRRCALSEALDKLTLDQRFIQQSASVFEKMENRLKEFRNQMQNAKLDAANIQQMTLNSAVHERTVHHNCLEQLEKLQRENFTLMQSKLMESDCDDLNLKRKLDMMPCYEALYSFTNGLVRKLKKMRWLFLEKAADASRAEIDLIATQSSLLITHAQIERLHIKLRASARHKRPASFHGENLLDRIAKKDMDFFLPFKLQGSRVEKLRKANEKKSEDIEETNIEEEFLSLFWHYRSMNIQQEKPPNRPVSRIEYMMREMSNNNRNRTKLTLPLTREKVKEAVRRPISLVEVEEQRRFRRFEESRRSIKHSRHKIEEGNITTRTAENGILSKVITSLQDVTTLRSLTTTPIMGSRVDRRPTSKLYDIVLDTPNRFEKVQKLEGGFITETRNDDRSHCERNEMWLREDCNKDREQRCRNEKRLSCVDGDHKQWKIQRSQPVHLTRIKPPSQPPNHTKARDLEGHHRNDQVKAGRLKVMESSESTIKEPCTTRLPKSERKSWLDRIRVIKRM